MKNRAKEQGSAAITTVLVLGAVVAVLATTVALTSISESQMSLAGYLGADTQTLVHGCAEVALLQLNTSNTLPASVSIPSGTCTVTTNSQVGSTWNFTVRASIHSYTKAVTIIADRSTTVSITSWLEVP